MSRLQKGLAVAASSHPNMPAADDADFERGTDPALSRTNTADSCESRGGEQAALGCAEQVHGEEQESLGGVVQDQCGE